MKRLSRGGAMLALGDPVRWISWFLLELVGSVIAAKKAGDWLRHKWVERRFGSAAAAMDPRAGVWGTYLAVLLACLWLVDGAVRLSLWLGDTL